MGRGGVNSFPPVGGSGILLGEEFFYWVKGIGGGVILMIWWGREGVIFLGGGDEQIFGWWGRLPQYGKPCDVLFLGLHDPP